MTFKKINKMGQAIFEYFILTTAVLAVILFFRESGFFQKQNPTDPDGAKEMAKAAVDGGVAAMGFNYGNTALINLTLP